MLTKLSHDIVCQPALRSLRKIRFRNQNHMTGRSDESYVRNNRNQIFIFITRCPRRDIANEAARHAG